MAQNEIRQPTKTYRGTIAEVFSHRNEIPDDSMVELRIFEEPQKPAEEIGAFGGKSVLEAFPHLFGTEFGGPTDISEHPEKYMQGLGETKNLRELEP
jgi:hypothetical protein